jgi:hypothetical protein
VSESRPTDSIVRISKRSLDRIIDLQQQLGREARALAAHHSRFVGATLACDAETQRTLLLEYRDQLHHLHKIIAGLSVIIDRSGGDAESA